MNTMSTMSTTNTSAASASVRTERGKRVEHSERNWEELVFSSHYLTTLAIREELLDGNVEAALLGTTQLMEAMSRIDRRAVKSHLAVLMMHIIKWKTQPQKRSKSWLTTIENAREEIRDIQEDTPSITNVVIGEFWNKALERALQLAEREMNEKPAIQALTWEEVFDDEYRLDA
jgi:ribonucleotide monophosphatase NagD (HAD superfamily)